MSFSRRPHSNPPTREYEADLFDEKSLSNALGDAVPDVVISTAWDTTPGEFWTSEANLDYRDATLAFARLCFEKGVKTFVGLGTMSEYGISPGVCNAESTKVDPVDIYSKSKIETGMRLLDIGREYGRQTNWLRIFQAFGPNEKSERFIPGLISSLQNKKIFPIKTPNYEMDWIHTFDIASATVYSVEHALSHFLDVGTGVARTVKDVSELICRELNLDESLLDYSGQIVGHARKIVMDNNSQLFQKGWKPAASLESRIRSLR